MGLLNELSGFTDDALRNELKFREEDRRQKRLRADKPRILMHERNWQAVYLAAENYIDSIALEKGHDDDLVDRIFHEVMLTLYGPDVFDWVRKRELQRRG